MAVVGVLIFLLGAIGSSLAFSFLAARCLPRSPAVWTNETLREGYVGGADGWSPSCGRFIPGVCFSRFCRQGTGFSLVLAYGSFGVCSLFPCESSYVQA